MKSDSPTHMVFTRGSGNLTLALPGVKFLVGWFQGHQELCDRNDQYHTVLLQKIYDAIYTIYDIRYTIYDAIFFGNGRTDGRTRRF